MGTGLEAGLFKPIPSEADLGFNQTTPEISDGFNLQPAD